MTHLTLKEIEKKYNIPYRTLYSWTKIKKWIPFQQLHKGASIYVLETDIPTHRRKK